MNSIHSLLSPVLTSRMNLCRWSLVICITLGLTVALTAFTLQAASGAVADNLIGIPDTHHQTRQRSVTLDGQPATLNRYERRDERNAFLEGEHFSTVIAADGTLKGFANISLDLVGKPLPSREHAEQIAAEFLRKSAPDLLSSLRRASVALHDEPIRLSHAGRNETVQLTGLKFKARNQADGRWFWVIVGGDEKPMLFERDLEWATLLARRKTEQWLHDRWIKSHDAQPLGTSDRWSLPWTR